MMELIFWASALLIIHAYFGYPLSLYLWSKIRSFKHIKGNPEAGLDMLPSVTVMITAANEENHMVAKLKNTLALDYPERLLQIVVALDRPTDNTERVVRNFRETHLANPLFDMPVVVTPTKVGKEGAQKLALQHCTGEIIVCTDASTVLNPNAIRRLVSHFADRRVGSVDGISKTISKGHSSEGFYLKYENYIRKLESLCGGLVTLGGSLFAVRRSLYHDFSDNMQSDFRTALVTKRDGLHSVLDTEAVAGMHELEDTSKEYGRKHRTIVRGINTFLHHLFLLNPFKYGIFSYQFFCHKMLKWLVPVLAVLAIVSSGFAAFESSLYEVMFLVQVIFYQVALATYLLKLNNSIAKLVSFFITSNAAIAHAWYSYARGERFVSWVSSKR